MSEMIINLNCWDMMPFNQNEWLMISYECLDQLRVDCQILDYHSPKHTVASHPVEINMH